MTPVPTQHFQAGWMGSMSVGDTSAVRVLWCMVLAPVPSIFLVDALQPYFTPLP